MKNTTKAVVSALGVAASFCLVACEADHQVRAGYVYDGMWIPEPYEPEPQAVATAPAPAPAPRQAASNPPPASGPCNYNPSVPPGWSTAQLAFPTGDVRSSALLVHELMPASVRAGQNFSPEIHVT